MPKTIYKIIVMFPLLLLGGFTSCSDDRVSTHADNETTIVTLRFNTEDMFSGEESMRGLSGTTKNADESVTKNNDEYIDNLTVYIFDNTTDEVIGYAYGSYTIDSQNSIILDVVTRLSSSCTIYAVANAHGNLTFDGSITNKTQFLEKTRNIASIADGDALNSQNYGIMVGSTTTSIINDNQSKLTGTPAHTEPVIELTRIFSKIKFNITPNNTSWPITLTKYQLCNVPTKSFVLNTAAEKEWPTGNTFSNCSAVTVTTPTPNTSESFTYYTFENMAGKVPANNTYEKRISNAGAPNASYIKIWASTTGWDSEYKVYLGGKSFNETSGIDYTDYNIYRNYDYTVNIDLQGPGTVGVNVVQTKKNKITFKVDLDAWGDETEKNLVF